MKNFYDIQQFIKKYGTIIYTGDRIADLELMEDELRDLYNSQIIDVKDFQTAILILRHEIQILKDKRS